MSKRTNPFSGPVAKTLETNKKCLEPIWFFRIWARFETVENAQQWFFSIPNSFDLFQNTPSYSFQKYIKGVILLFLPPGVFRCNNVRSCSSLFRLKQIKIFSVLPTKLVSNEKLITVPNGHVTSYWYIWLGWKCHESTTSKFNLCPMAHQLR